MYYGKYNATLPILLKQLLYFKQMVLQKDE